MTGTVIRGDLEAQGLDAGHMYYVDGSRSDAYTETGSYLQPYKTVQAAFTAIETAAQAHIDASDMANSRFKLHIGAGTYNETMTLYGKARYLAIIGDGVTLDGTIALTTSEQSEVPGGSGYHYHRYEFIGGEGNRAYRGDCFRINAPITATRNNDSLFYLSFIGTNLMCDIDFPTYGTFVLYMENCYHNDATKSITGTFASSATSYCLLETRGATKLLCTLAGDVCLYDCDGTYFNAINTTPYNQNSRVTDSTFNGSVTIAYVSAKTMSMDSLTYASFVGRTPTVSNLTYSLVDNTVVNVADSSSATCWPCLFEAATGIQGPKTDAALTYNASTGALSATSMGVATGGAFTYNAVNAIRAQTALNNWYFGNAGNLSASGSASTCVGEKAGLALAAQNGLTAVGYYSGSGLSAGNQTTCLGNSAGYYYGAGTDVLTSATTCVYLGAASRANANTMTNEIVIGYNAIGAGSNTATLGNTSITSTVLRGAVSGPTSYTATNAGVAKSITDILTLNNSAHAADMDGTGIGILFNLTENTGATLVDAGRIVVAAEQDLTSTASTQDSYMAFYTSLDGANAEKVRITSAGYVGIGNTPTEYLCVGTETENATNRKAIRLGAGGYAAPGAFNTASNGDKIIFYSGTDFDGRLGVSTAADVWFKSVSTSTADISRGSLNYWTGQGAVTPSAYLRLSLSGTGLFALGGTVASVTNYTGATLQSGASQNLGFCQGTWGTSAAKVFAIGSGTAPTTSPADAVQMWSGDFNAAAGKAALHLRDESGVLSVFGNNWGLFTAGAEVIDATANKCLFLSNGTAPSAHTDDGSYIYAADSSDSLSSLCFYTEQDVEDIGSFTATKKIKIRWNGLEYWVALDAVA